MNVTSTDRMVAIARSSSIRPARTGDPADALRQLDTFGAVILTGTQPGHDGARAAAQRVLGDRLLAVPDQIFEVVDERIPGLFQPGRLRFLDAHTDGYSYGDLLPDYLFLQPSTPAGFGGESILLDGYAAVDALADAGPPWSDMVDVLASSPIDQVPAHQPRALSPALQTLPNGRRFVRRNQFQRVPDDGTGDAIALQQALDLWHAFWHVASSAAAPFEVRVGELLCVDNYRLLHGRTPYLDQDRLLFRLWGWSTRSRGLPSGQLVGDHELIGKAGQQP